jgi:vacuole morphology and inheritance protein 14
VQIDTLGMDGFATRLALGTIIGVLLAQTDRAKDKFSRVTAVEWLSHFIVLGRTRLAPWYPALAATLLHGLSDPEGEFVKDVAKANTDLMFLVRATPRADMDGVAADVDTDAGAGAGAGAAAALAAPGGGGGGGVLQGLLRSVRESLCIEDRLTRTASLRWLAMLLQQAPDAVEVHLDEVLRALMANLSDSVDIDVLKMNLEVLARLSTIDPTWALLRSRVLRDLVRLFGEQRALLESKAAFILRRLCLLLDPAVVYLGLAEIIARESNREFAALLVELLNLILLTSAELADFRDVLRGCAAACEGADAAAAPAAPPADFFVLAAGGGERLAPFAVYSALYRSWVCNPVAAVSLCLLAHSHELAARLVAALREMQVTVGLLMQVDKLVQLLESPVFIDVRLALIAPPGADARAAAHLLTALFGLLMLLPQGAAYATLRDRLTAVTALLSVRGGGGGGGVLASAPQLLPPPPPPDAALRRAGVAALDEKFSAFAAARRAERDAMSAEIRSRSFVNAPPRALDAPPLPLRAESPPPPQPPQPPPPLPSPGDDAPRDDGGGGGDAPE